MSYAIISAQASAAFGREHNRKPKGPGDHAWLYGYDQCRSDNAAAMALMEDSMNQMRGELYKLRGAKK